MTLGMVKRAGPELELQNWSPVLAAGFAEVSNSLKICQGIALRHCTVLTGARKLVKRGPRLSCKLKFRKHLLQ